VLVVFERTPMVQSDSSSDTIKYIKNLMGNKVTTRFELTKHSHRVHSYLIYNQAEFINFI